MDPDADIHPSDLLALLVESEVFGLLLIIYDLIWLPMQVFDPADSDFSIVMGVLSSIYWSLPHLA